MDVSDTDGDHSEEEVFSDSLSSERCRDQLQSATKSNSASDVDAVDTPTGPQDNDVKHVLVRL